jgi:hypothetical protein
MPPCREGNLPLSVTSPQADRDVHLVGPTHIDDAPRKLIVFTAIVLMAALFLQRFGLPAGAKSISIVGPIGIGAAVYGVANGYLSFSPIRLFLYLALSFCAVCGLLYHATTAPRFAAAPVAESLAQFLVLTSFATLSFAYRISEERFFALVTRCLVIVAGAGLLQFAAQFIGLKLFSFRGIVPSAILFEDGYNLSIPIGIGSLLKANGFFLLEPSIFSQFMALGLVIELLTARRSWFLGLFAAGLVVSGSGTGWLVLAGFLVSVVLSMGGRGMLLAVSTIIIGGVGIVVLSLLAPQLAAALSGRLNEITEPSTSGHLRFITPFWVLGDVLARQPLAALLGIGAGVSERLTLPYEYDVNTPIKIFVEYGFPALLAYLGTLCLGSKTLVQRALVLPGLVLLLFTGGYQQFPPVLFPVLLIISVAKLEPGKWRG